MPSMGIDSRIAEKTGMVKKPSDSRRTHRVHIAMSVLVYANEDLGGPLKEVAQTRVVNATGGLILLSSNVVIGQKLLLVNVKSEEEILCTVVTLEDDTGGKV